MSGIINEARRQELAEQSLQELYEKALQEAQQLADAQAALDQVGPLVDADTSPLAELMRHTNLDELLQVIEDNIQRLREPSRKGIRRRLAQEELSAAVGEAGVRTMRFVLKLAELGPQVQEVMNDAA